MGKENSTPNGVLFFGAVGGIRTLGPVKATRFPIVLVMTTSIPLQVTMFLPDQDSTNDYIRFSAKVNTLFKFCPQSLGIPCLLAVGSVK